MNQTELKSVAAQWVKQTGVKLTLAECAERLLLARVPQPVLNNLTADMEEIESALVYQGAVRWLLNTTWDAGQQETFTDILGTAAAPHFTQATYPAAVALAGIARREGRITLRGAFYRAVSAGIYPDTDDKHYRQCGNLILKLRRQGLLPYACIVDSTRRRLKPSSWSGLADYAETVSEAYRKDLWARQPDYVEIFVEKDAMAAVIEPVTARYDIHLNVIRGGCSESFVWQIAQEWRDLTKPIFVYYLGDHDPSGLSIETDLRKRLSEMPDCPPFYWQRLAIDRDDFARKDLIGFPVKGENRNSKAWKTKNGPYLERYGDRCVEVDAIPGDEIRSRLQAAIESHIDPAQWNALLGIEEAERESFKELVLAQKGLLTEGSAA